jgi:hypothetical protein
MRCMKVSLAYKGKIMEKFDAESKLNLLSMQTTMKQQWAPSRLIPCN